MYYLSEKNNLRNVDRALGAHTSKFGTFEHRLLTHGETRVGTKRRFDKKESRD